MIIGNSNILLRADISFINSYHKFKSLIFLQCERRTPTAIKKVSINKKISLKTLFKRNWNHWEHCTN